MLLQRDKICKVGDVGQPQHRRIQRLYGASALQPLRKGILVLDVHRQVGHHPQHRQPGLFFQHGKPGAQDLHVSPELVDHQSFDPCPLLRFQQCHGAVELGEHPAPVNVPCQQHRGVHQLCQPHVDDVVCLQVDLGGAACPLNDDDVVFGSKAVVGGKDLRDQAPLHPEIVCGGHLPPHLSVYNDLTAHVAAGLQQDRVHPYIRLRPRCLCLHHLGTSHFQPAAGDKAVQCHVLAFKGCHPVAVLSKDPAQGGAQQAFACPAHGALDHNALCLVHFSTSRRVSSSCVFSSGVRTAVRYHPASSPG